MNRVLLVLLAVSNVSSALAADPFAGTWKQNKQMGGGALYVASDTPVIKQIEVIDQNTAKITDSENGSEETFTLDGTFVKVKQGRNAGDEYSLKRLHPKVWEFHRKTHGRTYPDRKDPTAYDEDGHYTISVDGKIMIWAVLRTYSDGRIIYYNRLFERQ